jgi:subtilisin family serine protease
MSRRLGRQTNVGIEGLERRDCPAVVSIVGPTEVAEAGNPVTFTATLSAAQSRPVEVTYFTSGTATTGQDYRLSLGRVTMPTPSGTLTFRPGVTSLPITFTPINDTAREGNEAFRLSLAAARGHTLGARTVAISLIDDDNYTATLGGPSRVQPNTTTRFTLQLSAPATRTETFFVNTEDRSASTAPDYAPLRNLPITFAPGQRSKEFSIVTRPAAATGFDRSFVITATPQAKDFPAIAPFTVTLAAAGAPPAVPAGPALTSATFTSDYGWGVVNASASVAKLLGRTTAFPEVANPGGVNWGPDLVRAPEVWAQGLTGRGIVVAVVDTGVDYTHPSLRNSIWVNPREVAGDGIDNDNNGFVDDVRGWDFASDDNNPMDEVFARGGGHGTHVAGTIAAAGSAYGPRGIAPDAKIMPVRFLGAGSASDDDLAGSIRYAASNGAHVINLSLGDRYSFDSPSSWPSVVTRAISYATSLGSVVVGAAGNAVSPLPPGSSPDFPASLATMPGVLSVGAIDKDLRLGDFSFLAGSSSAMKHVVAPGVAVRSTVPAGYSSPNVPVYVTAVGTFADMPGTSMAAPHVAGVVALALSAVPNPKAPGVRDRVVNAIVTTSQQPPSVSRAAMAAASGQSGAATASTKRAPQAFQALSFQPADRESVLQSAASTTQASSGPDSSSRREVDLRRAMVFRALGSSSDTVEFGKLGRVWAGLRVS